MTFHEKRRMFAVDEGNVLVAQANDPRSHIEWLASIFGYGPANQFFDVTTRGYYLDKRLVAYIGQDFSHRVNHKDVKKAIQRFQEMGLEIISVELGAVPSSKEIWDTKIQMDLETYTSRAAKSNQRAK